MLCMVSGAEEEFLCPQELKSKAARFRCPCVWDHLVSVLVVDQSLVRLMFLGKKCLGCGSIT